jgi:hypothetical protein
MKIRIKGNSVRFRLTKSDLANLGVNHIIGERTEFMSNSFVYEIHVTRNGSLATDLVDNHLILQLPAAMLDELIHTERVGFSGKCDQVSLLVEKDFTCLDNVDEDQSDNFTNPLLQLK